MNRPTSKTHDAVSDLKACNTCPDFADRSDDIFSEDGRKLLADEQARISATLVVGIEACLDEFSIGAMV